MDLHSLKPAETKEIDISKYFNEKEPIVIVIRHYTNWLKNEIQGLMTAGQEYDQKTQKVIFKNMNFQNQVLMKELIGGVQSCPFPWNEETIKEIDEKNPELLEYILKEIEDFNSPFEMTSNRKSPK